MISFLMKAIRYSAVFLYGSTGEIITEKSGHLNLGIPGVMSIGASVGCLTVYSLLKAKVYNSILLVLIPVLATIGSGAVMGLIYSFMTVTLRANQNVTGLALTTFGVGLSGYLINGIKAKFAIIARASKFYYSPLFKAGSSAVAQLFLSYGPMVYLAIVIAIVTQIIFNRTRVGLHLRAVGEDPATADAAGINVTAYRYGATVIGSAIAALGGLFMIMDQQRGGWDYIMEGFGWLSIALVIFALWRPALSILGSIIFGGLSIVADVITANISLAQRQLLLMIPYVMTIIVLIATSIVGSKKTQPPASLGVNYFREDR